MRTLREGEAEPAPAPATAQNGAALAACRAVAQAWRGSGGAGQLRRHRRLPRALESMQGQIFWGGAAMKVDTYPKATLTLVVYTVNLDKKWVKL
ncbi:hypothetical protein LP420_01345 [Massilia sp. B-10]|nr:hypothetical protein LP420_01345 [Massilia sp. B-10]